MFYNIGMKTNNKNPKIKSFVALLIGAASLSSVGCNSVDKLFFTVKGKDLEVTFCDRAASIYSIKYKDQYITYHPKDYNTFLTSGYCYGRTLGRITGRIKDGKLKVDGKEYQLEMNEVTATKNNSIHGGKNGLPSKDFKRHVSETNNVVKVSFNYFSPDGEANYPGDLDTWVTYTVYKKTNRIDVNITATSDRITPVNITTHPFFRLGNEGDIKDHELTIKANKMAEFVVDSVKHTTDQVPVGTKAVSGTPFDFTTTKTIGKDIEAAKASDITSGGYDHIWYFGDDKFDVKLKNPKNGITLQVDSDADAIIMYANCYPHENDEMNPSGKDTLYSGISVEPYKFFTKDQDSIDGLMITPDKPFERNITYTITQEK